jgi:anthranilate synthase/phosphoribosyltransferase
MILLLDNYDSFTYNIYQYLCEMNRDVQVLRNDRISVPEVKKMNPDQIIISPGPGSPEDAGISVDLIAEFAGTIPILGICLGHQAIAVALGGKVVRGEEPFHGKISRVTHDGKGLFAGVPNPFRATRYHSLMVQRSSLPGELQVTAESEDGAIMAVRHRLYSLSGLQFHPESIGTENGRMLLRNFVIRERSISKSREAIKKLHRGISLCEEEASGIMEEITSGIATPAQIACLLTSMSLKGETAEELTGFARVMRRNVLQIRKPAGKRVVDTCGTGGDGAGSFNISTVSALVAAGAGAVVAKHGNRSVTSMCGSADVLESLGVTISASPAVMERSLEENGIAFLFAPGYHSSMKYAAPVRRDLGIRTVFNLLGPLANPAGAHSQVIGVFHPDLVRKIAEALLRLGTEHSLVVHGRDGLDEISLTGLTDAIEVSRGWMKTRVIDPADYGMTYCSVEDLSGGDRKKNAEIALSVLSGEQGPRRNVVVLNAAAAILVGGIASTMEKAITAARRSIDSNSAMSKLEQLVQYTGENNE